MRRNVLMAAALLLILAAAVSFYSLLARLSENAEEEVLRSLQQTLGQTARNISERMEAISSITLMLGYDYRMQTAIKRTEAEESIGSQLADAGALREMIEPILSRADVSSVRIYLSETKMISRDRVNFFPMQAVKELPEYEKIAADTRGEGVWTNADRTAAELSHARFIRTLYDYEKIGAYIVVGMPADRVLEVMRPVAADWAESVLFLLDDRGDVALSAGGEEPAGEALLAARGLADGAVIQWIRGEEAALLREPLSGSGWSLVIMMPRAALIKDHRVMRSALMLLAPLMVLLLVLITAFLAYGFYTRGVRNYLHRLNEALAEKGISQIRGAGIRDDYRLAESIDGLILTLNQLTEAVYRAQLKEREAHLRALQAQINPHFLYNTLDMINWRAMRRGASDVSQMLETLAHYFRLSLSGGSDIVPLRVEIDMARSYLALQAARFDHKFDVRYEIEEDAMDCLLPKLTIQPLVENALLHGIRARRERAGGEIKIGARIDGGLLCVCVWDNGPGLAKEAEASGGFGLRNVRERLALFAEGNLEMTLTDAPEGGAQAALRFPAKRR